MEDTIMKKTYMNPEMVVVKLQTMQMLASSVNLGLSEETVTNEGDLLSRENDWDED
jgi:hypothetical protein